MSRRCWSCCGLQPISLVALLATLVLLFGFQGEQIMRQPLVILLLAVPIVIQVYLNAGIAYGLNRALGVPHNIACPSALIGASNFFELAVAAAIALFGFQSGAALATVVGVLVEVPVMLSVVRIVLRTRGWYQRGERQAAEARPSYNDVCALAESSLPEIADASCQSRSTATHRRACPAGERIVRRLRVVKPPYQAWIKRTSIGGFLLALAVVVVWIVIWLMSQ